VAVLRILFEALAWVADAVERYVVDPIIDAMMRLFRWVAEVLGRELQSSEGMVERARARGGAVRPREQMPEAPEPPTSIEGGAPGTTAHTTNDFRGSRITVNQEFRQADPDRVFMQFVEDMRREAQARTQSGFAPALTR
jgi:hypothetical protein